MEHWDEEWNEQDEHALMIDGAIDVADCRDCDEEDTPAAMTMNNFHQKDFYSRAQKMQESDHFQKHLL